VLVVTGAVMLALILSLEKLRSITGKKKQRNILKYSRKENTFRLISNSRLSQFQNRKNLRILKLSGSLIWKKTESCMSVTTATGVLSMITEEKALLLASALAAESI
jgi:hypothetical protein